MTKLTVLYDYNCGLCQRARRWLEVQRQLVPLEFIPAGSDHARYRFPALAHAADELAVIADDSAIYRGDRAWIMCLYALEEYREWALRLAAPRLLPLARAAFQVISENRMLISRLFRLHNDEGVARELARYPLHGCVLPAPRQPQSVRAAALNPAAAGATNGMKEWLE